MLAAGDGAGGGQASGPLPLAGGGAADDPQGEQAAEHGQQVGQDLHARRGLEAVESLGEQAGEHEVGGGGGDGGGGDAADQPRGHESQPPPAEQLGHGAPAPGGGLVGRQIGVAGPPAGVPDLLGAERG